MRKGLILVIAVVLVAVGAIALLFRKPWVNEEMTNGSGNAANGGYATLYDGWVYYVTNPFYLSVSKTSASGAYKMRLDGTENQKLDIDIANSINIADGWIYYNNGSDNLCLYRVRTTGEDNEKLSDDSAFSINIDNGWVYYTIPHVSDGIYRIRTNGTGKEKISDADCFSISVADDWVYYIDDGNEKQLYRIRTDCTDRQLIINQSCDLFNVADGCIYYRDSKNGKLRKIFIDSMEEYLFDDCITGVFNVSGEWIYFYNVLDKNSLYKVRTDGTEKQQLCTDSGSFINIAGDWIHYKVGGIPSYSRSYLIRTDGTDRQELE